MVKVMDNRKHKKQNHTIKMVCMLQQQDVTWVTNSVPEWETLVQTGLERREPYLASLAMYINSGVF